MQLRQQGHSSVSVAEISAHHLRLVLVCLSLIRCISEGSQGDQNTSGGFYFPPLPIYKGEECAGLRSKGWQLLGVRLLKVLGYVDVSLTLRRVNAMEELRAGSGDWVCSVALLLLGTVAS